MCLGTEIAPQRQGTGSANRPKYEVFATRTGMGGETGTARVSVNSCG